jgi:hypothetical protein
MIYVNALFFIISNLLFTEVDVASKYTCRTAQIHIETSSRFMDVVADNYQVYTEVNPNTGKVIFQGLMKSFEFEMGALDRAFNSSSVDISQYSKFNFDGRITNLARIDFNSPGTYNVNVEGQLFIGSYIRKTSAQGSIKVLADGRLESVADFTIRIEEESMNTINELMRKKLPSVVSLDTDQLGISRDIKINLKANYRPRN